MNYDYDECDVSTTLGYDVVRFDADGKTTRLGTYSSLKVAKATADEYPDAKVTFQT